MPGETRVQARQRITAEIMDAARRQLAEVGAAGLSLRAVARDVGMVSSAVYRYVDSRDELLTMLIGDAYNSLGEAAEAASCHAAGVAPEADLDRWTAVAFAIRTWAIEHPHEYLLLYGSPVPGYAAPDSMVEAGTRVIYALVGVVADASAAGRLDEAARPEPEIDAELAAELDALAMAAPQPVPPATTLAFLAAWTQMFGLIGFELTNQTRGVVTDNEGLFVATVSWLGYQLGLRSPV